MIKNKQSKDDVTKRASVRRSTLGRSKLSRSPVKSIASTVTSTNPSNTTATANSQSDSESNNVMHERVLLVSDEIIGPVTRSRVCRFRTPSDELNNENNHKRGKRSLSNSRFHDKKNKLSRKNQILATTITGTRKLRKEASLDSALVDVGSTVAQEDSLSSTEPAASKDPNANEKSRLKKPTIRSASQKVFSNN